MKTVDNKKNKKQYYKIRNDSFPKKMKILFYDDDNGTTDTQFLYEKVTWKTGSEYAGLRYGENPDQSAALYKLSSGHNCLDNINLIEPGTAISSGLKLLQAGKHPSKINITDIDTGLGIIKHFPDNYCAAIIKHNNPCGVALGNSVDDSFRRAYWADPIAAFGGTLVVNNHLDIKTAQLLFKHYLEVIAATSFEDKALELLAQKKNLRLMLIPDITEFYAAAQMHYLDFQSLLDGGIIVQSSYLPSVRSPKDLLPAKACYQEREYSVLREPTAQEEKDMIFGWLVESQVTSNSVLYVKEGVTLGIGTGEQDRVGVATIARDKAIRNKQESLAWDKYSCSFHDIKDSYLKKEIYRESKTVLKGSTMVSDGFFPFKDGVEIGLRAGVTAVIQPGGSLRDYEVIEACNEFRAAMKFTGERAFKH